MENGKNVVTEFVLQVLWFIDEKSILPEVVCDSVICIFYGYK